MTNIIDFKTRKKKTRKKLDGMETFLTVKFSRIPSSRDFTYTIDINDVDTVSEDKVISCLANVLIDCVLYSYDFDTARDFMEGIQREALDDDDNWDDFDDEV